MRVSEEDFLDITTDGRTAYLRSSEGITQVDLVAESPPRTILPDPPDDYWKTASLSPDGSSLAASSYGPPSIVRIIEVATGVPLNDSPPRIYEDYPLAISFAPDGNHIAAAFRQGTFLIDKANGWGLTEVGQKASVVQDVAVSPDSTRLLVNGRLWSLSTGKMEAENRKPEDRRVLALSNRFVVFENECHLRCTFRLYDLETGSDQQIQIFSAAQSWKAEFSSDSRYLAFSDSTTIYLWDTTQNKILFRTKGVDVAFSQDSRRLVVGAANRATIYPLPSLTPKLNLAVAATKVAFANNDENVVLLNSHNISVLDSKTGAETQGGRGTPSQGEHKFLSRDGQVIVTKSTIGDCIWDRSEGAVNRCFNEEQVLGLSTMGKYAVLKDQGGLQLYDVVNKTLGPTIDLEDSFVVEVRDDPWHWMSFAFLLSDTWLVIGNGAAVYFINTKTSKVGARVFSLDDETWIVVDPDGRFDTGDIDAPSHLFWIMPDDPFIPVPPEVFMRDYYEPRLLTRILTHDQLKLVRNLSQLNRVQPRVLRISARSTGSDTSTVTVELKDESRVLLSNKERRTKRSGAYDLRLFRSGQLVGTCPGTCKEAITDGEIKPSLSASDDTQLQSWREASQVLTSVQRVLTFENIRLPHLEDANEVEFMAYAFNEDRVKSETVKYTFRLPEPLTPQKGRAYVMAVGVNAYEQESFDLSFAAADAQSMVRTLVKALASTRRYAAVVPVVLISDYRVEDRPGSEHLLRVHQKVRPRVLIDEGATKANVRAVLGLLSGKVVAPAGGIKGVDRLQKAAPDDLVIMIFASHGYRDSQGRFYLVPYDTGQVPPGDITEEVLQRFISSDELSLWLRDLDAGEMVMIVDSCHSAAAVASEGFKPGPMSSRGMGQLAYDKGMRVLTASQADDVARETKQLKQGLLTYALVRDGARDRCFGFQAQGWKNYFRGVAQIWSGQGAATSPEVKEWPTIDRFGRSAQGRGCARRRINKKGNLTATAAL